MTTMQSRILAVIRRIPRGKVSTYGAVARAAGYPRGARANRRSTSQCCRGTLAKGVRGWGRDELRR